ncbi:uncharacterized protein [Bombus fervidus]|uniref:uncharacterized protein n=1 Tax=Bombus fervidus TaxID=203811 RepID=UPI003AB24608
MDHFHSVDASHSEKNSECTKTVHKRRSSVFQSRTITFNEYEGTQCVEDEKTVDAEDVIKCVSKISPEKPIDLEEYIINLRNERKEWIETLKQRKVQRKNLAKQKLYSENGGQLLDLNVLAEYEKAFVTARPNYQHIYRNYKKLSDVVAKTSVLYNLTYKLNQRFVRQMERRLCKVNDKIIEILGS